MEGSDFTIKEIVRDTNNKLDKFIEKVEALAEKTDNRIDKLEQHKASVVSNFQLMAWLVGASGAIFAIVKLVKFI